MTFLFVVLKGKPEERTVAFIAVGNIAKVYFKDYKASILVK